MNHHNDIVDVAHGHDHGSLKSYIVGFILSIVLTLIPFALVYKQALAGSAMIVTLAMIALCQLLVQLVFFLHLSTKSEARWNLIAFIFTLIVVVLVVGGTLWIMFSLYFFMA